MSVNHEASITCPLPPPLCFPLAFSNDVPQAVLDIDGDPVVSGREYQTHPGLSYGRRNSTCPVELVFLLPPPAVPLKFTPVGNDIGIYTDTPLKIEFNRSCDDSPKWVVFVDTALQVTYVGMVGPEDHPGQQAYSGTFKILKSPSNNRYNLAFCLPIIVDGSPVCWNIKLYHFSILVKFLVLTNNEPDFEFVLIKAPNPEIRTVV